MNYTLNELIEKMRPQAEKDNALMRRCVSGLALYAGQRAQADPASPEIAEMRALVENIACYWGMDDGSPEKLHNDFMKPFESIVAAALTGENLEDAIDLQRASTVHGLYRYGLEMVCAQGLDSKDDILAMSGLIRKLAYAWDFESDTLDNMANGLDAEVRAMETTHESEQPGQGIGQLL